MLHFKQRWCTWKYRSIQFIAIVIWNQKLCKYPLSYVLIPKNSSCEWWSSDLQLHLSYSWDCDDWNLRYEQHCLTLPVVFNWKADNLPGCDMITNCPWTHLEILIFCIKRCEWIKVINFLWTWGQNYIRILDWNNLSSTAIFKSILLIFF